MNRGNHKFAFARIAAKATSVSVALDERDRATHEHCDRVAGLSMEVGVACGLSDRDLKLLQIVAGFHDVGKIGIPDRVLKKLTRFTDDDWAVMREHPSRGERIIRAAELEDGDTIALAVRHHHERAMICCRRTPSATVPARKGHCDEAVRMVSSEIDRRA